MRKKSSPKPKQNAEKISQNPPQILSETSISESVYADIEYTKSLKIALEDAINKNDDLALINKKLREENRRIKIELKEKNKAIFELGKYYEFCQENHMGKEVRDDAGREDAARTDRESGHKMVLRSDKKSKKSMNN